MNGQMMDFPLTITSIFRRAETFFRVQEVVTRRPDKTITRYRFGDFADRTRRLIRVLQNLGVQRGDRVATLAWTHAHHLKPTSPCHSRAPCSIHSTCGSILTTSRTSSITRR